MSTIFRKMERKREGLWEQKVVNVSAKFYFLEILDKYGKMLKTHTEMAHIWNSKGCVYINLYSFMYV